MLRSLPLAVLFLLLSTAMGFARDNTALQSPATERAAESSVVLWSIAPERATPSEDKACCVYCRQGKACGNACIAEDRQCHEPPGCACDGA